MVNEKRVRILIVDDEEDFRKLLRFHFEDFGWEVVEAVNGLEALEVFSSGLDDIEVVITDIRMPKMDGQELIRELQRQLPDLPIIGVTGHMDLKEAVQVMGQGAYYYFHKPIEVWEAVDPLIKNAVRQYRNTKSISDARRKEIEIARLVRTYIIESSLPPECKPSMVHTINLDIAALPIDRSTPSGDFAEWFNRSPGEVCLAVSDFSGHGELLACFMACLSSAVLHRCHHAGRLSLGKVLTEIDRAVQRLHQRGALRPSKYLTFFLAQINLEHRELDYVNAAHPAAFLLRSGRGGGARCTRLGTVCKPIGFLFGAVPELRRVQLFPGDVLFVYTDGASELLQGEDRAAAGLDRLEALLYPLLDLSASEIVQAVGEELVRVAGGEGLPDDTTLLVVKILPAEDFLA